MNSPFGLVKDIVVEQTDTWRNKIFVTCDTDWCSDEVLDYTIDYLIVKKIPCTIFATHQTEVLTKIRSHKQFNLGIHPNFNPLILNGSDEKGKNADEIIKNILKIVPEAVAVRCHSITQSSILLKVFRENGLIYELNTFIPVTSKTHLEPFNYYFETVKLPYFWQDDTHLESQWKEKEIIFNIINSNGLRIINFHPIHFYLNTEIMQRYNEVKSSLQDVELVKSKRNLSGNGIFNLLDNLFSRINKL